MTEDPPCSACTGPPYACRNCRRPVEWVDEMGWLHTEVQQRAAVHRYFQDPINCGVPEPVHQRQGSRHGR